MKTDKEYIQGLKNDDYASFDGLFKKYAENIFAFILSITKDAFTAEEISQTVFLKVWEKRMLIEDHFSFKSFLFRVTYNETISHLRKVKAEKKRIDTFTSSKLYLSNETEYLVEFRNLESIASQIIENLPEKRKQIFKLSREQGLTNKEIAGYLHLSVKTVENQMSSALKTLKNKLRADGPFGLLFYFVMFQKN